MSVDYDENSSMLPPMKPMGNSAPSSTQLFGTKRFGKEELVANNVVSFETS